MKKEWLAVIGYLISGEESRLGRRDPWNSVYLAGKRPFDRTCLSLFKVLFVITLSFCIVMGMARL